MYHRPRLAQAWWPALGPKLGPGLGQGWDFTEWNVGAKAGQGYAKLQPRLCQAIAKVMPSLSQGYAKLKAMNKANHFSFLITCYEKTICLTILSSICMCRKELADSFDMYSMSL